MTPIVLRTMNVQLHVIGCWDIGKGKGLIVDWIDLILLFRTGVFGQGFVEDPLVLFQLKLDIGIRSSKSIFIDQISDVFQLDS
jgi:hypothetical protein